MGVFISKAKKSQAKTVIHQPYRYVYNKEHVDPDWKRFPGYKNVTENEWNNALWQRRHMVKDVKKLKEILGKYLTDAHTEDILRDQKERATMAMLVPPHMINMINEKDFKNDPIRKYMIPFFSDRQVEWSSHPMSSRDSLHEADMWVVEGLTHRYPTKVLAEVLSTCPQYCGHCTRMDLVGQSVAQVDKTKFSIAQPERHQKILDYLRKTPQVRDVVVSGGDLANLPAEVLEKFILSLLDIENIRDIRLATKGLMGLPQHFMQNDMLVTMEKIAKKAFERGVSVAIHTHINHVQSVTSQLREVTRKFLAMGFRDVRNQGVLLAGVNDDPHALLDLCFKLIDYASITPYYFYMCDMIPNSEHWRVSLQRAQQIQHDMMGYLPGYSTPRLLCDVPFVGKRWVHQTASYDKEKGISYWTKNYLTSIEAENPEALNQLYCYYDPIHTLPSAGQKYWKEFTNKKN